VWPHREGGRGTPLYELYSYVWPHREGGGVLPYMGYIGMSSPKGCGFSAIVLINRESILADFGHFSL